MAPTKSQWEQIASMHPEANFLHSWNWGEFHQSLGKTIHRISLPTGIMLAIEETAKRGKYLTVPGGPLIDWSDKKTVDEFVSVIKNLSLSSGCSFVRVRPQILDTTENRQLFHQLGFNPAPMHLHAELTHQLDLSQPEAVLLANMRKATRYEINRSQKLAIRISTSEDIDAFYDLQLQTSKRQKFVPFSRQFLVTQFHAFAADNQAILYSAHYQDQLLAQAFVIFYGQEADYHYGASTELGRKYPGAYAIQWAAIKEAQARGLKRYNFWGVAPENATNHRFHGVSVFKRGFHGEDVAYLPAHDLIINPIKYRLNWLIESLRKKLRRV